MSENESAIPALPADDLGRALRLAQQDNDGKLTHIGLVGDTYTILLGGKDTNEKFCVIDMHVPPGGGPGPHRHDFEETFIVLDGEVEVTFRGSKYRARAGETVNIPANAPHQFHNGSFRTARMICICAPAGNERFFMELGVPVATRTTAPPEMSAEEMGEFLERARALAPKYRTELLTEA
jgi:quercetin dioxygenase-like cupin family protein